MAPITWEEVVEQARAALHQRQCPPEYHDRLKFELKEIEKQGAVTYWMNIYEADRHFDENPSSLILPWLLGMVAEDPIATRSTPMLNSSKAAVIAQFHDKHGFVPPDLIRDPDQPDIDIDCLPEARDPIKDYATKKYGGHIKDGYGAVCSVGTWQTYKFRSAIIDVCAATGWLDKNEALALTTNLPDDVDDLKDGGQSACKGEIKNPDTGETTECGHAHNGVQCPKCGSSDTDGITIGQLLQDYDDLKKFTIDHPKVIEHAVKLVGRVRNMGMHAGALIIADRPLYGNIPLAKNTKRNFWISMWTEGRNTQLSKFGFIKWDILGLKTLQYIYNCCRLIEANRNISFGYPVKRYRVKSKDGSNVVVKEGESVETDQGLIPVQQLYDNPDDRPEDIKGIIMDESSPIMSGWDDIDPSRGRAGHFFDKDGNKHYIDLNDQHALALANDLKTDGIFQFDTELAKQILSNGVKRFDDLLLFNAMGHPGPMQCVRSDSLVNTTKGPIRIDQLNEEHIQYYADDGTIRSTRNYHVFESGEKEILTVETEDGKQLNISPDHRFLTKRGYVRAAELNCEDEILVDDS